MLKRTIVIGLILFLVACDQPSRVSLPEQTKQDLALMPADLSMLLYCNLEQISDTDLAKEVLAELHTKMKKGLKDDEYEAFKSATGFDPERDLRSVLWGAGDLSHMKDNFFAIIRGSFSEEKIVGFVKGEMEEHHDDKEWRELQIAQHTVYLSPSDESMAVCFVDDETVYAGSQSWIEAVLEGRQTSNAYTDQLIADLSKKLRYSDQIWLNLDLKKDALSTLGIQQRHPQIENLQNVTLSARLSDGLAFEGLVQCSDEESSKLLTDLMKGAIAAAKLQSHQDRATVDALNAIKIDQRQSMTAMYGDLSPEFFNKLREQKLLFWESI